MQLTQLTHGQQGVVESITSSESSAKRLADIGFVRGARLQMVRPGDPCIVRIDETCVGLGFGHQKHIYVGGS